MKPPKIRQLPAYLGKLVFQAAAHLRAGLPLAPLQFKKAANLAETETKPLHALNEAERLQIVFAVPAEAANRPRRSSK
ncbi:MAG: hypothetical protein WAM91_15300 [Candidatus Acidiferrales bacterium]